ncbi:hypothetical protein D9M72_314310 [compost metagenome]
MKACSLPHSSAHWPRYTPIFSALNQVSRTKPGIASCLTPKAGIIQAWITSLAVVTMRIFLLTGTTSSLSTSIR